MNTYHHIANSVSHINVISILEHSKSPLLEYAPQIMKRCNQLSLFNCRSPHHFTNCSSHMNICSCTHYQQSNIITILIVDQHISSDLITPPWLDVIRHIFTNQNSFRHPLMNRWMGSFPRTLRYLTQPNC